MALTVAVFAAEEDHDTRFVRLFVLPSEYVPVTCNGRMVPAAIVTLAGAMAIDWSVTPVTRRGADVLTEPSAALIIAVPGPSDMTKPVVLTDATDGADDVHAT
jgi:hypothetical protein